MAKKLYVGNLTYGVTDSDLQQLFEAHGTVTSAQVVMDRDTGRSKGFGFVEMGSDQEAQAAIAALDAAIVGDEGRRHVDEISPALHQCLIEARDDHGGRRTTAGPGPRVARCRHRPCEGRLRGDN